jgi:phage gp36-like protein
MAFYTTEDEVRIATGFNDPEKIDAIVINSAIAQADSIINAKIGKIYQLPLASTPAILNNISLQIAKSLLYMQEYGEETQNLDKGWEKNFNFQLGLLDQIAKQKLALLDDDGVELALTGLTEIQSYPNNTSNLDLNNPTANKFSMNSKW